MAKGHPSRASRYSAYTGGPDPLAPPVDLAEALEEIGRDVMEGTSPRRALQELLRSAQIAQGLLYNPTPLVAAAIVYFLMFWPFVRLVSRMQNKTVMHSA